MTVIIKTVSLLLLLNYSSSSPVQPRSDDEQPQTFPSLLAATENGGLRINPALSKIGSALAPVVGAVVGPLLVNIANGITNGITTSLTLGYEPLHNHPGIFGNTYEAYLVNNDDDTKPYLLLNPVNREENNENLHYYGAASNLQLTDNKYNNNQGSSDKESTLENRR